MKELSGILFGAIAAGIIQWAVAIWHRRNERRAILEALIAEVRAITKMVRAAGYPQAYSHLVAQIERGSWDGASYVIDFRSGYFSVFEGLASKLGYLSPGHATEIVEFYMLCKTAVDSSRPDGPPGKDNQVTVVAMDRLLREILLSGDSIVQYSSGLAQKLFHGR